jgi:hypothetical protein
MRARRFVTQGILAGAAAAITLGALLAPARALSAGKPAAPRLSAEQIVARNVAARGGLEAWRKVKTMLWTGHIESVRATVPSLQFMLAQERPNKLHFEINAMGDRTLRVFDGTHGWKLHPAHGRPEVQAFSDEELRFERSGPGIEGVLFDYAAKGSTVEVKGIDEVEKRKAYHLVVRTEAGETQHVWVDTKTFLELRYDRPAATSGAPRTVSVVYRDYKDTEGLKIPSIIETGVGAGTAPDRMIIEKVVLNPPLDAQAFGEPGAPRKNTRAARGRLPFPPHRPPGPRDGYPPPWALPAPAAPPATPSNPAPAGAPQPGSPAISSQDPGSTPH